MASMSILEFLKIKGGKFKLLLRKINFKNFPNTKLFGKRFPNTKPFGKRFPNGLVFGKRFPNSLVFGKFLKLIFLNSNLNLPPFIFKNSKIDMDAIWWPFLTIN